VRIFTPRSELPFAGHPTVGTAAVLVHLGSRQKRTLVLEEGVGPIEIDVTPERDFIRASFTVEKPIEIRDEGVAPATAAAALSVEKESVKETWLASAGLAFNFIRLADRAAVDRAMLDRAAWKAGFAQAWSQKLYFFAQEENRIYSRMFAPGVGVEEDPATGSAAVALAGTLATRRNEREGTLSWRIDQGVAMGRPSLIEASAEKRDGRVVRVRVGGGTVIVGEGTMNSGT
jgi:trans-2,3-dihydro-3-hydroxyanthranilate isomerase